MTSSTRPDHRPPPSPESASHLRNPKWDADETLLGLEAYLRLRPLVARPDLEVIQELSALLRLYGRVRSVDISPTFRNPDGVSRKVGKFGAAARGEAPSTVRGAELEAVVWNQHSQDPEAVSRAADALRLRIYAQAAESDADDHEAPAEEPAEIFFPSQGPAPSFGTRTIVKSDGECVVYVHALEGAVENLFDCDLSADVVIKVGRSNAVHRRLRELNAGFPPAMRCRWAMRAVRPYQTAGAAHAAEQALLKRLAEEGRSLGGEFARVPRDRLPRFLESLSDN